MKFAFSVAAAIACTLPAAAMAHGKPAFDGSYVGVVAGLDHVVLSAGGNSVSKDGFLYGVVLGYDKQIDGLVLGAEAEIDGSTAKESATSIVTPGDSGTLKAGRDIYVGARIGERVLPATLLYIKAGYTNARATVTYTGSTSFSGSKNLDGFRLGAGVEQSFGSFAARVEYRFSKYSNIENTGLDAKRHQVVASLIARF